MDLFRFSDPLCVSDVWNCAQSSLLRRPKTSTKGKLPYTTSQALYFWEKAEVGLCSYQQLYQWCSTSAGIVTLQKSSQPNFARLWALEDELRVSLK